MTQKSNTNASCSGSKSLWQALLPFFLVPYTNDDFTWLLLGLSFFFSCNVALQLFYKWESHQNDKFYMKVVTSAYNSIDVIWWNRTNSFSISWKFPNERIDWALQTDLHAIINFYWNWVRNLKMQNLNTQSCICELCSFIKITHRKVSGAFGNKNVWVFVRSHLVPRSIYKTA